MPGDTWIKTVAVAAAVGILVIGALVGIAS